MVTTTIRYSGGDTVYNHLGRDGFSDDKISGCRVFRIQAGKPGFSTWVRLYGGEIQQTLDLRP